MGTLWCLTFVIAFSIVPFSSGNAYSCPNRRSPWDKWYDGCNWCVCTETGLVCTDKTCLDSDLDRCEPTRVRWRDGCYRCSCRASGIVCSADQRCVDAMRHNPISCERGNGCVCGLDGVPSCAKDSQFDRILLEPILLPDDRDDITQVFRGGKYPLLTCDRAKRWYTGARRCFCRNGATEPVCGEPRAIASRVDGYRFKVALCFGNQESAVNCKRCTCHMLGLEFCVRIPNCKKHPTPKSESRILHNIECQPETRWRVACRDCRCTRNAKIICTPSDCNYSGNMAETNVLIKLPKQALFKTGSVVIGDGEVVLKPEVAKDTKVNGSPRRFQIPPWRPIYMSRSFRPRTNLSFSAKNNLCEGKYKPGDRYYIRCNYCLCTSNGVGKCTAINCTNDMINK